MRDVNFPLRKRYFSLLSGITYNSVAVPVYYQKAPNDISSANYIVFGGVSSNDLSSKYKADTETSIRITVHTFANVYNSGEAADSIAGTIFSLIYPDPQTKPDLSADTLQIVDTHLANDFVLDYNLFNTREYVDRIIVFRHRIFHQ